MRQQDQIVGIAAGSSVAFIWSGWLVLNRLAAEQTLTPWDIIALRFIVAAVALTPFFIIRKPWRRLRPAQMGWLALLGPAIPYSALMIVGLSFAPAAHGGVVANGLLPAATMFLAWMLGGAAPNRQRWIGVAIITVGVAAIGGGDLFAAVTLYPQAWKGHLLFVLSAVVLAGYMVLAARWSVHPADAASTVAVVNLAVIVPLWLLFLPSRIADAPWGEILMHGLYQGLGPGFIGFLLFTLSIRRLGAPRARARSAVVPAGPALFGVLFLGETLQTIEVAGVICAVAGIAMVALAVERR
ncbi:MAG: DMT family transporter [Pseudomonadota bacterium]